MCSACLTPPAVLLVFKLALYALAMLSCPVIDALTLRASHFEHVFLYSHINTSIAGIRQKDKSKLSYKKRMKSVVRLIPVASGTSILDNTTSPPVCQSLYPNTWFRGIMIWRMC